MGTLMTSGKPTPANIFSQLVKNVTKGHRLGDHADDKHQTTATGTQKISPSKK
ncbi:GL18362 [Drosophila persimilis]|uniref:GL18362 n=1 Tax=Drosophila persimilis TaxID=7234 RepID=B4IRG4_DROPE|nr:GL18362 [Drosophila persimilis]